MIVLLSALCAFLGLSVLPFTMSQTGGSSPTCQQLANQTVFKQCLTSVLGVKDTMGAQKATDQIGACYTQIGNNTAYQRCLCAKTSAILDCYDSWCQGDAGRVIQFNYQLLFCKAYHSGQPLTALPTLTGIPVAPKQGEVEAPTNDPVVPRNYGSQPTKKSDAFDVPLGWPFIVATVFGAVTGSIYFFL